MQGFTAQNAEVYVRFLEFDVDTAGRCMLLASWRILSPGGETVLKIGQSRLTRQGSLPDSDPAGAITSLSALVAEFSSELAQTIKQLPPAPNGAAANR